MKALVMMLLAGVCLLAETQVIVLHQTRPPAYLPPMPSQETMVAIVSSTDKVERFAIDVTYSQAGEEKVRSEIVPAFCGSGRCNGSLAVRGDGLRLIRVRAEALATVSVGVATGVE